MGSPFGGKNRSQPSAPSPEATAAAQAGYNKEAAIATARLNQVDEVTPFGTTTYEPTGEYADGIQRYRRVTELSPEEQNKLDQENIISNQLLGIGQGQLGQIAGNYENELDFSGLPPAATANEGERARIENAMFDRLQPQFDRDEERLRTRLANSGFAVGTDGYNEAMDELGRAKTDARLAITAAGGGEQSRLFGLQSAERNQALNEMLTERSQPINELAGLMGTSPGVNLPQFSSVPTTGVAPADYTGPASLAYSGALSNYNQSVGQQNALMGGLFGLGSSLGAAYIGR